MCTLALAYKVHTKYPLIFVGNRDEFFERHSRDAYFHDGIISGIDLEKGGTWTGISESGKFACITNYRDFTKHIQDPNSRGLLLSDFFSTNKSLDEYLKAISEVKTNYNPYNLILGTLDDLRYYSNISDEIIRLTPGIYGLSNAFLDTPWPKVERIKRELEKTIALDMENDFLSFDAFYEQLFMILENREIAEDFNLPTTGIDLALERSLSSLFIELEKYGTRYETVILVDALGEVFYFEKALQPDHKWHLQRLKLKLNSISGE